MLNLAFYNGNDLGAVYSKHNTRFRLWAPTAEKVRICFYETGDGGEAIEIKDMYPDVDGTWIYAKSGDLHTQYYTYLVTVDGCERETNDPYSKATGVNGKRSMVVDLEKTNPKGFESDKGPIIKNATDLIVYETSIVDTTMDKTCGAKYPGTYKALTQTGTKTANGEPTGLDHILALGVTHVQLMPCYDFGSVDESKQNEPQYNWGYDPTNYNVPEGSFSTDPFHGEVRIKEFKEMVQTFHKKGIGVIMDVVYNHTYDVDTNPFQRCVPNYYYRITENGEFSNASACGNEVATEHPMVRKYIIDSLKYWASEYHIDGFRFDLMGVYDIDTMNLAAEELKKINPSIVLYGEGWTGGPSVLPDMERALKNNVFALRGVGAFSDDIRDAIRGDVFILTDKGFISGKPNLEHAIRYSVVGATGHPGVDYSIYGNGPWANHPVDVVNYVSCHDNLTLWDKISVSCPKATNKQKLAMNRLAASIVFTSQGIPFFLSGEEFARTKPIEGSDEVAENSYNMPHYTNNMRYDRLEEYKDLEMYYRGLIAFRKEHEGLRLGTAEEVRKALQFVDGTPKNVVVFTINMEKELIFVAYNANKEAVKIELPEKGDWKVHIQKDKASAEPIEILSKRTSKVEVAGVSSFVAVLNK